MLLKRAYKQVEIRYSVIYQNNTVHSERILAVSPEILHTERDELASFQQMCCVTCRAIFPCHMTYIAEPKLVNVTNWNRRLLKWTEEFFAFY